MVEPKNCRRCGKIFSYSGGLPICPQCIKKDEAQFDEIKQYLYENPGATMLQIAEALDIPVDKIMRYLREGRLQISNNMSGLKIECEKCGKSINTGRFCKECLEELQGSFRTVAKNMDIKNKDYKSDNVQGRYRNRKLEIIYEKDTKKKD